jgi:hypothetical protein
MNTTETNDYQKARLLVNALLKDYSLLTKENTAKAVLTMHDEILHDFETQIGYYVVRPKVFGSPLPLFMDSIGTELTFKSLELASAFMDVCKDYPDYVNPNLCVLKVVAL